jgi:RNase P subunit RPR2
MAETDLHVIRKFSELPLETRLRRTCRGCGNPIFASHTVVLAFVTGPSDQPVKCPLCGWSGVK